ncbi:TRAP transporter large permease [Amorphus sp. MBR-141]
MTAVAAGLGGMFLLVAGGIPIAFAMALAGFVGFALVVGVSPAMSMVGQIAFDTVMNYNLSVLPLFILMGNFITRARLSEDLYTAAHAFVGHFRGGMALSTLIACGGFSAVSGSSLATAATMSRVAMPEMRRFGYSDSLASGSIAAGGTLGILIPPSVALVLFGIMTGNDIGKLFIAGILPGLLGLLLYCLAVLITTGLDRSSGPPGVRTPWAQRLRVLGRVWGVLFLFAVVIGGIYLGVFTTTEAAGIGAAVAAVFAIVRGGMRAREIYETLLASARMTAMIFAILIGAMIFANFVNVGGILQMLDGFLRGLDLSPLGVLLSVFVLYLVLGMVLESMSMMLLTVPIFYPLMMSYGYDPIWFGIFVVVVIEISLITPPVGMNVFVLRSTLPDTQTSTIFRGVMPFVAADILRLLLIIAFPWLVLVLPGSL